MQVETNSITIKDDLEMIRLENKTRYFGTSNRKNTIKLIRKLMNEKINFDVGCNVVGLDKYFNVTAEINDKDWERLWRSFK